MFIALNLRGVGASVVSFGTLLAVGTWVERAELANSGTVLAVTVIGGSLLCSLYALTTDRCDSPGIFRPYFHNFLQTSYEAFGHEPPDYFAYNPARSTAMFAFPLALFPHVLAISMFCFTLPGMMRGNPTRFDAAMWRYLPVAMISAALATIYGYATSGLRQVDPPIQAATAKSGAGSSRLNMRNWQILCGILVAAVSLTMLALGREFRQAIFIGLGLGIGPLSIFTAIMNFDWYFNDRSMRKMQKGAFGFEGPQAARATICLIGAVLSAVGVMLVMNPDMLRMR